MEFLADYGIAVTSYENDENGRTPIITHIGWGKSISQALDYLKSHLISDYFFNSTFEGVMMWRDNKLDLDYSGNIISITPLARRKEEEAMVFKALEEEMVKIRRLQKERGIPEIINDISKKAKNELVHFFI